MASSSTETKINDTLQKAVSKIESSLSKTTTTAVSNATSQVTTGTTDTQSKATTTVAQATTEYNKEIEQLTNSVSDNTVNDAVLSKLKEEMKSGKYSSEEMKALAKAYIKNTYGSKEFMESVKSDAQKNIESFISDSLSTKGSSLLTDAFDMFDDNTRTDLAALNSFTTKINKYSSKLNDISKLNIAKELNTEIADCISIDEINKKLNNNKFLKVLQPTFNKMADGAITSIVGEISTGKSYSKILESQEKLIGKEQEIQKVMKEIATAQAEINTAINNYKNKLKSMVDDYAKQVVSDIVSKIKIDVSGIKL